MDEQKKIKILNVLDALLSGDNEPDKFSEEYLDSKIKEITMLPGCNLEPEEFEEIRKTLHHKYF